MLKTHSPRHGLKTAINPVLEKKYVERYVQYFRKSDGTTPIRLTSEWAKGFPVEAGVYAVFNHKKLIYVGETGSLRGRMKDLRDTRNHTLRRQLGETNFRNHKKYRKATSKRKFPETIEKLLNKYIETKLSVKARTVSLGRKEIEERLIKNERPPFNRKKQRKQ